MTRHWSYFVPGVPKAQQRPRAFARLIDGKPIARVYCPGTAEAWKASIALGCADGMPDKPLWGPVRVDMAFHMPRPKRLMRAKDPEGPIPHTQKPDFDNLVKGTLDALKTIGWFRDDAQVCQSLISKQYHGKAQVPGCFIEIEEMDA